MARAWRAVLAIGAVLVAACSGAGGERTGGEAAELRTCGGAQTVEGVDVSYYEGTIDWGAVARSGRGFAFARVSDGTTFIDPTFETNWGQIKAAGLVRGAYQFFRPAQDAVAQADLFLSKLGALQPGDLPPVLDVEVADGQDSATIVAGIRAWTARVKGATGRTPMIYAASGFWDTLSGADEFGQDPLWVANYGVSCPSMPSSWSAWKFWQYSESGSVPGISGGVDVDVFNGSLDELRAFAAGSAPLSPIEVYWARRADGGYDLRALPWNDQVATVEYYVDGYAIGSATKGTTGNFPASYTFSQEGAGRHFEARGYDASHAEVASGVGMIDVTAGTAVYIKEMGASLYEIGLERPPSAVAAIEVRADGTLLTDSVSGQTRSTRSAVRSSFQVLGPRTFQITTFGSDGAARGTITRSFTLQ